MKSQAWRHVFVIPELRERQAPVSPELSGPLAQPYQRAQRLGESCCLTEAKERNLRLTSDLQCMCTPVDSCPRTPTASQLIVCLVWHLVTLHPALWFLGVQLMDSPPEHWYFSFYINLGFQHWLVGSGRPMTGTSVHGIFGSETLMS